MKPKMNVNIGCVMSLKWSHERQKVVKLFFIIEYPQVGRHLTTTCHLLICPPRTQNIKRVISRWVALLIMEDDGCTLTFANVTKG